MCACMAVPPRQFRRTLAAKGYPSKAKQSGWLGRSGDLKHAVEEAHDVFPDQVVKDQHHRRDNWKGVRGNAGDREVEKTRDHDAERREQNPQQSAVRATATLDGARR